MVISHIFGKELTVVRMTISITSTETTQAPDHVNQSFRDLSIVSRIEYFLPDFPALPFHWKKLRRCKLNSVSFLLWNVFSIIKRLDSK